MEPPSCKVECINHCGASISLQPLAKAVQAAFQMHGRQDAAACLLLTDDGEIQDLNLRFRSVDSPTDVLTFPSGEHEFLGDVAISVPYAARQAVARGVSLEQELGYLAIHGALHLLGYDDETENDRVRMVDEMNRVALSVGLQPDTEWASILHAEAT
jgi:probable rRNA maturation factor